MASPLEPEDEVSPLSKLNWFVPYTLRNLLNNLVDTDLPKPHTEAGPKSGGGTDQSRE